MLCEALHQTLRKELRRWPTRDVKFFPLRDWYDDVELLMAARHHNVHVVILTLVLEERIPSQVERLLDRFPWLIVVGIDFQREEARMYSRPFRLREIPQLSEFGILQSLFGDPKDHDGLHDR
jgi:hypothetical protein